MEQLNYRFLNYKHYDSFLNDLSSNKVCEDSIVFIQDKPCIWARGKEYVCDGPNTADIQNDTFTFKNGKNQVIFSISQEDGTLTLTDEDGNSISSEYVSKDLYDEFVNTLDAKFGNVNSTIENINNTVSNLQRNKQDKLIQGENIHIEDNTISAVFDTSILNSYVTNSQHSRDLATKQNVLIPGNGVSISNDIINVDIDTNPIAIVTELPNNPNQNKIYLLETTQEEDTVYIEYRYINNAWVELGRKEITIDLTPYITKEEVNSALNDYLSKEEASETYQTITDDFYNKSQVYTKTEIDNKQSSLQSAIDDEIQRATNQENTISYNISSEVERLDSEINTIHDDIDDVSESIDNIFEDINTISNNVSGVSDSVNTISDNINTINGSINSISNDITDLNSEIEDINSDITDLSSGINNINSDLNGFSSDVDSLNSNIDNLTSQLNTLSSTVDDLDDKIEELTTEEYDRATEAESELDDKISTLQSNKQDKLTAGEGININNNTISVDDYISERDINGKLQTLQQLLGQIYVLKADMYTPNEHTWSNAPIYSFGDIPVSGGGETPNNTNIYVLNQNAFDVLEQNNEVRNDVCYLITD